MRHRHTLTRAVLYASLMFVSLPCITADTLPKGLLLLDGREAPPLVLNNLDGEPWDISQSRGHWLFVHFWASWCGPCRKEMPTIQAIFEKFDSSQLEIVLINTAESEDTVFTFLAELAPDITPLMDRDGLVTEQWQPRGLPATFFVDPEGRLQYLALGGRPWDSPEYLTFVQRLIRQ
jgi:thiol-disulfide isomerase/thioredoxin